MAKDNTFIFCISIVEWLDITYGFGGHGGEISQSGLFCTEQTEDKPQKGRLSVLDTPVSSLQY
jgi:hypothetical protein